MSPYRKVGLSLSKVNASSSALDSIYSGLSPSDNPFLSTGTLPLVYKYTLVAPFNKNVTQYKKMKPSLDPTNALQ